MDHYGHRKRWHFLNFRYVKESKRERESKRVKEIEFECVRWIYRERLCEYVGEREKEKDLKAKKFECHHFRDPLSLSLSLSLSPFVVQTQKNFKINFRLISVQL